MKKNIANVSTLDTKVSIMIEILMEILRCSYSDAYSVITHSNVYRYMKSLDYATLHDSPQANLCDIGKELRMAGNPLGDRITSQSITNAMLRLREKNSKFR